jgi:ribosome-associated toxin RatA of RatAB toxin-antitoxin module
MRLAFLPKTLQRFLHPLPARHGHTIDTQCTLDLIVAHHIVLRELAQTFFVQWQLQSPANGSSSIHQPFRQLARYATFYPTDSLINRISSLVESDSSSPTW